MMRSRWALCLISLILPACLFQSDARRSSDRAGFSANNSLINQTHDTVVPSLAQEHHTALDYRTKALTLEAKLHDIPFPVSCEPIPEFFEEDNAGGNAILGYTSVTDKHKLFDFFKSEFIRLGWQQRAEIKQFENLLVFEKPDTICIVSLRSCNDITVFIITICPSIKEFS